MACGQCGRRSLSDRKVIFLDTPKTREKCLVGLSGLIERSEGIGSGVKLFVLCTDTLVGPAGPFELALGDVEIL